MEITTKLVFAPRIPKDQVEKFKKILYDQTYQPFLIKINTTKLEIIQDKKDLRAISGLKNLKIIFKPNKGIIKPLILMATLSFNFGEFCSELFVWRISEDENLNFETVKSPDFEMRFSFLRGDSLELFQSKLVVIKDSENFEFNLSQFDDFIAIFNFYKAISNELNNDANFPILNQQFSSYYFVPIGEKNIDLTFAEKIYDDNDIIVGYKFTKKNYWNLNDEEQEKCLEVFDLQISGSKKELRKIKIFGANDCLYLSQQEKILNFDVKCLQFSLVNLAIKTKIVQKEIKKKNNESEFKSINQEYIVLTGSIQDADFKKLKLFKSILYLNLYDLGQRTKIETIESSIKEITKATTNNAIDLFEYIIGSKDLPNIVHSEFEARNREKFLTNLDQSQKAAFLMATDGNPVSLIKGPPGTGKTHVIEAIINYLVRERKEKVLVSSQTHVAIDNVLDKIMSDSKMIIPKRITNRKNKYDNEHIDKTLFNIWNKNLRQFLSKSLNQKISKQIITSLNSFKGKKLFDYSIKNHEIKVIGVTTTASQTAGKKGYEILKGFDWLIIDEVSKCPITEVIRYLPYVKRIIMVGDDYQLAPLLEFTKNDVKNFASYDEEKFDQLEKIYQESVFASLYDKALKERRVVQLNNNYRSVKDVLSIYNVFYDDQLQNKRETISTKKVFFNNEENNILNRSDVLFIEVIGGSEVKEGTSRYNVQELIATKYYLEQILKTTKKPETITIAAIFLYSAQIKRFSRENKKLINQVRETFKSFELNTVDAFQGQEADIVLVNTVVTDSSKANFLSDFRRINVALSRAKDKVLIFGNARVLQRIEMQIYNKPKRKYFNNIIEQISYVNKGFIEFKGENNNEIRK